MWSITVPFLILETCNSVSLTCIPLKRGYTPNRDKRFNFAKSHVSKMIKSFI